MTVNFIKQTMSTTTRIQLLVFCIGIVFLSDSFGSNLQSDCRNGSTVALNSCADPVDVETTQRPASQAKGCTLPNIEHSRLTYEANPTLHLKQGESVPHLSLIVYQCEPEYLREGPQFNLCNSGSWFTESHAICTRYCRNDVLRGVTFKADCQRNGVSVFCDDPIRPGTLAKISCQVNYKKPRRSTQDILLCLEDGQWDYPPFHCDPTCGELVTRNTPFIVNGEVTDVTFVPWHVAIYKKESLTYQYHCAGSILNAKLIISAAICFWDKNTSTTYDKSHFVVGAGKRLGDYDANEPKAQFRNISNIIIPQEFTSGNYEGNIALVVLESHLQFTPLIAAICIEWVFKEERLISASKHGRVSSYGRREENGISNNYIRIDDITAKTNEECRALINSTTDDKFCATNWCDPTTCMGSAGSGFVLKKFANGKTKHYIWGVAGVDFRNTNLITFTNIQFYKRLIIGQRIKERPK